MISVHTLLIVFVLLFHSAIVRAECEEKCEHCLTQANFDDGTYRILESGIYCIGENIVFNPRQPEDLSSPNGNMWNWFPGNAADDTVNYPGTLLNLDPGSLGGSKDKINGPFAGGFWAVITVETVDVEIDLQGYSIEFHPYFYTQQRFGTIIEVQNTPYAEDSKRSNGIWLWGPQDVVNNIWIHNGDLGLSPHHGIHSNGATNVVIEDLTIHDFEVGGVQFNDFQNITLRNLSIGPSATNVQLTGYYGTARYDLLSLFYTDGASDTEVIEFADGRAPMSVTQIRDNLIAAMDIAFRYVNDVLTAEDLQSEFYQPAIDLFVNTNGNLPDGSTLYGIVFNSWLEASQGFGQINQYGDNEDVEISGVLIENVEIHDLKKATHEVPAMYMNPCFDNAEDWGDFLYARQWLIDAVRTPLGPVIDLRLMIEDGFNIVDNGLLLDRDNYAQYLRYAGNVYTDAQVALKMYGAFKNRITTIIEDWATVSTDNPLAALPECMNFVCDSDFIYQTNKGIIGARFDEIENVVIRNLEIHDIDNVSPVGSLACGPYTGTEDGGNHFQLPGEGNMNGDVRGVSIYGSDVRFEGELNMNNLASAYGNVYGLHVMTDSIVMFDADSSHVDMTEFYPQNGLSLLEYDAMAALGSTPWPNHFRGECNIRTGVYEVSNEPFHNADAQQSIIFDPPLPPNGVDEVYCSQFDAAELSNSNAAVEMMVVDGAEIDRAKILRASFGVSFVYVVVGALLLMGALCMHFYCASSKESNSGFTMEMDQPTTYGSI
eukprot:CAMPEP_0202695526 /NCGR_PEP_ID=MMETSP1385-20130828/9105_1 /ASSEMBLY_ACC=CAM_ASM_000861 /TAXON_ID=933848 /ORGANISM="Elphidium margaritaceum" /LENGTH=769 /DNA_ID=CAMNT_0049351571 /DNA_START=127 /DNA_END=2436 /DNA_ORIENTATION=-